MISTSSFRETEYPVKGSIPQILKIKFQVQLITDKQDSTKMV